MRNWGYQTYQTEKELLDNYVVKFNQIADMKKNGLSGAVYTQTTDVEGEVNGLLTYDREIIKIPARKTEGDSSRSFHGLKSAAGNNEK